VDKDLELTEMLRAWFKVPGCQVTAIGSGEESALHVWQLLFSHYWLEN